MSDLELIKAAADRAGIEVHPDRPGQWHRVNPKGRVFLGQLFNPLDSNLDAMDLLQARRLHVVYHSDREGCWAGDHGRGISAVEYFEKHAGDEGKALRRAITRAAAKPDGDPE